MGRAGRATFPDDGGFSGVENALALSRVETELRVFITALRNLQVNQHTVSNKERMTTLDFKMNPEVEGGWGGRVGKA